MSSHRKLLPVEVTGLRAGKLKTAMDTSCCDALNQEKINHPEIVRPLGNFTPSLWGDYFTTFSCDNELWEKSSVEVEGLKEQVRSKLIYEVRTPHAKMVLIDTLERLGVAYHFEDEIEEILQQLFSTFTCDGDHDLYNVALCFRLFRQHGYNISSDIFNQFKGSDGKLKEALANDVLGMLSFYEAANLAIAGDDFLDEATSFIKTRLQSMLPKSTGISEQVKRSLYLCLHKSLPRVEARNYIDVYGSDPSRNEMLLRFAKTDYNLLQLLHLKELSSITKWWNDIQSLVPYARDRIVECYFWSLGVYFEPCYSVSRIVLTKLIGTLSLLDDTFDSYGTVDELKLFRNAVERWEESAIEILPDYLKIIYKFLLDLFKGFEEQFKTQGGSYGVSYVKQEAKNIVRSYYVEAKWFMEGHLPSFDDYLANALVTCTYFISTPTSFLGMKEAATNREAFDWLRNRPKALTASATICRLRDDIATYEVEKARGQIATGIECYMYQYNISKEDAVEEFNQQIEKAWKDLNEECLKQTIVSKRLIKRLLNLARLIEVTYREGDGYTHPEKFLKDMIILLVKSPIPLS